MASANKNSSHNSSASQKDVVYIDVDDEITSIIDKVRGSSGRIVALVLPKRASVMQSVVNMKLLKRTASEAKKHVVLITSETGLLPIAGIAGVHVASSMQSKPEIPVVPAAPDDTAIIEADTGEAEDAVDARKSVGELAAMPAAIKGGDTIEINNDDPELANTDQPVATGTTPKLPFNKKLKVPNFDSFRTRLLLAVGAFVVLIIGWIMAFHVMPRATITIKTDTTTVNSELGLIGAISAKEPNEQSLTVPAINKDYKKTDSQKAPATGQKDVGNKAKGTMTVTNCTDNAVTLPVGTQFTNSGFVFVTSAVVTVPPSDFFSNGNCKLNRSADVEVTAGQSGDTYNLSSGRSYTSNIANTITGKGSSMTGGTTKMVKVVSQEDVDNLKQKMMDANNSARDDLAKQLRDSGYLPLNDTFVVASSLVTASPNVGSEASEVTVNVVTTFTMFGAKQDAVTQLVEADIKKKIDTTKQTVLQNGLDKATIRISEKSNSQVKFTLLVSASAGVQQDSDAIKQAISGKKKSQVQEIIQKRPGVKEVTVTYSPFWVYSTPGSASKITVNFEQQNGSADGQ